MKESWKFVGSYKNIFGTVMYEWQIVNSNNETQNYYFVPVYAFWKTDYGFGSE